MSTVVMSADERFSDMECVRKGSGSKVLGGMLLRPSIDNVLSPNAT